jgi:hypothetical protein
MHHSGWLAFPRGSNAELGGDILCGCDAWDAIVQSAWGVTGAPGGSNFTEKSLFES